MARRMKFRYEEDVFEGLAHMAGDGARLILTHATMTTAQGQSVSYNVPLMFDREKLSGVDELGYVEAPAPWNIR